MLGSFAPHLCRMSVEHKSYYRSVYCGICHGIKELYGRVATMGLVHDAVVLALLAQQQQPFRTESKRCIANPLRRVEVLCEPDAIITTGLALNTILLQCKYYDNQFDGDRFSSSLKTWVMRRYLSEVEVILHRVQLRSSDIRQVMYRQWQQENIPDLGWEEYLQPISDLGARISGQLFAGYCVDYLARSLGRLYIYAASCYDGLVDYQVDVSAQRFNIIDKLDKQLGRQGACQAIGRISGQFLAVAMAICSPLNRPLLQDILRRGFLLRLYKARKNCPSPLVAKRFS